MERAHSKTKKAACPRKVHPIARSLGSRSLRLYNWMPDPNSSVMPLDQNGTTPGQLRLGKQAPTYNCFLGRAVTTRE